MMTKAQRSRLNAILYHVQRAKDFVADPRTIVARTKSAATTTLDFTLPDGRAACEIAKDYGSDLTGLDFAIDLIRKTLNPPTIEEED